MTINTTTSTTNKRQQMEHQEVEHHKPSSASTVASTTSSLSQSSTTKGNDEPYQELKWTSAPLFLNDNFDTHELDPRQKQTLPLHAGRTALLVVDVQPEYWSQCPAVRKDFPDFPERLKSLVAQCRDQKAKIIWVRADYRYAHSPWLVQFARLHQGQIPNEVHSREEDVIEWEDFATPQGGEYVIPKTSWSSTRHTALMDLLKQSGIDTVLVAGLITSVCVQHSAFGIFEAGYRTLLVTDACADRGKARHDAALALYGDYMYELVTCKELCLPKHPYYLQPAKPVWLTPDSINNLVQPQFFNTLQDSVVMHTSPRDHVGVSKDQDDIQTTAMSNLKLHHDHDQEQEQEHPTFYKMEQDATLVVPMIVHEDDDNNTNGTDQHRLDPKSSSRMHSSTATARTSTSSLSTMTTNPSPMLGPTALPSEEEAPSSLPALLHV